MTNPKRSFGSNQCVKAERRQLWSDRNSSWSKLHFLFCKKFRSRACKCSYCFTSFCLELKLRHSYSQCCEPNLTGRKITFWRWRRGVAPPPQLHHISYLRWLTNKTGINKPRCSQPPVLYTSKALNNRPRKRPKPRVSLIDSTCTRSQFPIKICDVSINAMVNYEISWRFSHPIFLPGYALPCKICMASPKPSPHCLHQNVWHSKPLWPLRSFPNCDCGHPRQTLDHLIKCPLVIPVDFGDLKCVNTRAPEWLERIDV